MRNFTRRCTSGLLGLGLVGLLCGCGNKDVEQLHKIGQRSMSNLLAAGGGPRGRLAGTVNSVRGSLSESSIDSRIAVRLAWDRELSETWIEVQTVSPGVVRLIGQVPQGAQRERAYDLARSTMGVNQVMNEISVGQ